MSFPHATPSEPQPQAAPAAVKPTWAFVLKHPAHFLGLGLGSGLFPVAPGTAGTLMGWALFAGLERYLTAPAVAAVIAVSVPVGWWACTVSARHLNTADPGCVVWDEIVAIWLVLLLLLPNPQAAEQTGWAYRGWQLAAFALFRFFDAAKPNPVHWADQVFKGAGWRGGWGIMFDDLIAACCTLFTLALVRYIWGLF